MDHSATFARHFARLVSLLIREERNVDEQKVTLRALVALSKNASISLATRDSQFLANEQVVPAALAGVHDVAAQMHAHSIATIQIGVGATASDLLAVARIVATPARPGDSGAHIRQALASQGLTTVEVRTTAPEEAETPALRAAPATEAATAATQTAAAILAQLAAPDASKLSLEELLASLDAARSPEEVTRALDNLVLLAEHSVRVGKTQAVGEVLHSIIAREVNLPDGDVKRAYLLTTRRLSKPAVLRGVAALILKRAERKQHYYEILARAGEDGADAVIEQISQAPTAEARGTLLEVFRELAAAVPALKRMLGDSRWFVVRNAADLLGELAATEAEEDLIALLRHGDDRVRRSATNTLLKLGTPEALRAIYEAVNDSSPEVRMQAAAAIATRKDSRTSTTLIRAIEDEEDTDVQLAMIAALGKIGTPDAVAKLVKMAEPEGRLFRKKSAAFRVAAVQALADTKTPAALTALRELTGDKERDVREAATRALALVSR